MPPSKKKRGKAAGQQAPALRHLVKAAHEGDAAAVTRLLAAGADPNALVAGRSVVSREEVQTTALCEAAEYGRLEAARLLLDGGADPSLAGGDGFTPLMVAARQGQLEAVRGVRVDRQPDLHCALKVGRVCRSPHFGPPDPPTTNRTKAAPLRPRAGWQGRRARDGERSRRAQAAAGAPDAVLG